MAAAGLTLCLIWPTPRNLLFVVTLTKTVPKDANYIAAYDLASDRERERVSRVLEGYGFRVQFSVFELRLTRGLRERLLADLKQLELKSGFIYLYRCDATARRYEAGVVPPRPHDESNHSYVL